MTFRRKFLILFLCLLICSIPLLNMISCSDDDDDNDNEPALYGPENSWWHANQDDVPPNLAGTGWKLNDTAYNFTLKDQNGDDVELYQFYGQVIVLDVLAYW